MLPSRPFTFIRHGQTDWNVERRMQGQTDIPLNTNGIAQAYLAARNLTRCRIHRIITSPLSRALHTAEIVAGVLQAPLHTDIRLIERAYGSYEGLNWLEIRKQHRIAQHESHEHILPPDAETFKQVQARLHTCLTEQLEQHPDETLLFVSHAGTGRTLIKLLNSLNGVPYHIEPHGSEWRFTPVETSL